METVTLNKIYEELEFMKKKLLFIEHHMVDIDTILSIDDELMLKAAEDEYAKGKTISLEDFEKELRC